MLKLWKLERKTGEATVAYPFAPLPVNKDMRGKPVHDAAACVACAACAVACPADAIWMSVDPDAETITWNINYGRCIFCGRCEESCPFEAIRLSQEFELAVTSKADLHDQAVYKIQECSVCGRPFAPRKEIDLARRVLDQVVGSAAAWQRDVLDVCPACRRRLDAQRAKASCDAANAAVLLEAIERDAAQAGGADAGAADAGAADGGTSAEGVR